MRQLWRALHGVPQLLLVQPEQLGYDLAYALGLLPLVIAAIVFFLQDSLLLFAISFLAGIVCLLAIQLARLSFGLPAWVGYKATHPLVASILIACFFSPRTPAWVAATMVILYVVIDTVLWPQINRVMLHPALIIFGLLFVVQRELGIGFINPFDGRPLADPLTLWSPGQLMVSPVKFYVGNVAGPIGVTSMGAVLIGVTYLWYTRKISLGVVTGFLVGIVAVTLAIRSDVGFQLASGSALFLAGYIAADRRRVALPEPYTFLFGLAAGVAAMIFRLYGEGVQAAWMGLLLTSAVVTVVLRVQGFWRGRSLSLGGPRPVRSLPVQSGDRSPRTAWSPVRSEAPQPVMAASRVSTSYSGRSVAPRQVPRYDAYGDPHDVVRQMRTAANRSGPLGSNTALLLAALLIFNPVGLILTWSARSMNQPTKLLLTAISVLWYLGAAGLGFALMHR